MGGAVLVVMNTQGRLINLCFLEFFYLASWLKLSNFTCILLMTLLVTRAM